ncbi:hypothetical protein CWE04_11280 [Thomasclavelia cocleata]|uniref:Uncharacterized protein n=1 Tax=Thomasclavelia cocleata TaxID=69824 RepID=A0A1I0BF54_9FIRM|nr:hypothetical protein [Thomasclavelia cocleata]MCR1959890.1 hypothetical protein [Thomasclavelia cocleata]NDO41764.1 hypothetical protein [Thomasclavelia cocleata]PJN79791.1 hypothetical protein CWE04_11280 [Thomasclavelia cocleata]SET05572.1 hypothetical protein SAMN04489758_101103 [Thomasclavelia cocleata]
MSSKEEYIKKHNVSEKEFLIYCVNALNDNFMLNDDDNVNDLKGFLYDLITDYFNGIDYLNKVIEAQKNNLTDSYMIGLYNGLATAKAILLNNNENIKLADNTIKPYKLEDLKPDMWVWDSYWEECFEIGELYKKKNEIDILIHNNNINTKRYETIKFEENRFYPVQCAMR